MSPGPCSQLEIPGQAGCGSLSHSCQTQAMNSSPESPAHCTGEFLFQDLMDDPGDAVCSLVSLCVMELPHSLPPGAKPDSTPTAKEQVLYEIPQEDVALGLEGP